MTLFSTASLFVGACFLGVLLGALHVSLWPGTLAFAIYLGICLPTVMIYEAKQKRNE